MFTAGAAERAQTDDLDRRIAEAVREAGSARCAELRIYADDAFAATIREELEARGFKNIHVPRLIIKTDVSFEW